MHQRSSKGVVFLALQALLVFLVVVPGSKLAVLLGVPSTLMLPLAVALVVSLHARRSKLPSATKFGSSVHAPNKRGKRGRRVLASSTSGLGSASPTIDGAFSLGLVFGIIVVMIAASVPVLDHVRISLFGVGSIWGSIWGVELAGIAFGGLMCVVLFASHDGLTALTYGLGHAIGCSTAVLLLRPNQNQPIITYVGQLTSFFACGATLVLADRLLRERITLARDWVRLHAASAFFMKISGATKRRWDRWSILEKFGFVSSAITIYVFALGTDGLLGTAAPSSKQVLAAFTPRTTNLPMQAPGWAPLDTVAAVVQGRATPEETTRAITQLTVVPRVASKVMPSLLIDYSPSTSNGITAFLPRSPFIEALRSGEQVSGIYPLDHYFGSHPPELTLDVQNTSDERVILTEITVQVRTATLDSVPLLLAVISPGSPGSLLFRNEGWGAARNVQVEIEGWGDLLLPAVPPGSWSAEWPNPRPCMELPRMLRDGRRTTPVASRDFLSVDIRSILPHELRSAPMACVYSKVTYSDAKGTPYTSRFASPVYLRDGPRPMGAVMPRLIDFTLRAGHRDTLYRRSLSLEVAPHSHRQVLVRLSGDRSGLFVLDIQALGLDGGVIATGAYTIEMLVPRSGAGFFQELEPGLRGLNLRSGADTLVPELTSVMYAAETRTLYLFVGTDGFDNAAARMRVCAVGLDAAALAGIRDSVELRIVWNGVLGYSRQRSWPSLLPATQKDLEGTGAGYCR